ncbi:MAG TPA: hypothetical protein VIX81_07880 [Gammaproteobacteria bacterium]
MRVRVAELDWARDGATWQLAFALPAGSFATVLLRELFAGEGL